MRKEIYRMDREGALRLLADSPAVHLATTRSDGAPVLRVVHGVVVGDRIAFHGAPAGEKMESLGRACVLSAEEIVAEIPSYFVDPERACPATTYYRSAQAHGVLEEVDDPLVKAEVLRALMTKYQPEGGHVPIDAAHPLYRKAIAGLLVVSISLERLDGKAKLGQNRSPAELGRILEQLWRRGGRGDVRAVDLLVAANPGTPSPSFLVAPPGFQLVCALGGDDVDAAVDLLEGAYWNRGLTRDRIARGQLGSTAWVGARDRAGRLVATARAIADGAKFASVYDVAVAEGSRGRGLGASVVRLLLDHPALRDVRTTWLKTKNAASLYARFGFTPCAPAPRTVPPSIEMVLRRP